MVLVVEHLVKSALQSIVWLMGSPQALVPTSIVHPVVHTVVYLYSQKCIAMVIIYIALIHLTLLASVVLVEVRSVIVIVEVTYKCRPESESNERSGCDALKLTCHSSRGERIIRITIVPIHL